MRDVYSIRVAALEGFDLAVARLDREGTFTFLNPAARKLFGIGPEQPLELRMLFPEPAAFRQIQDELTIRRAGKSSAYQTAFHRPGARPGSADIPVSVFAFPDADADGQTIGSIIMVRDLREEQVCAALHHTIESSCDNGPMLDEVVHQLRRLLDFEEFRITVISKNRSHIRRLYSTDPNARLHFPYRWWPMPEFIQKTLSKRLAGVIEIDTMRADPDYVELLKTDSFTRRFFESGVRQILSIPVKQGDRTVAFVSMDSREDKRYQPEMVELMRRLPISEMVMAAIHREESQQMHLTVDLIRRIGAEAVEVRQVAEALVTQLGQHFGWQHVSIFQRETCSDRDLLRLICQHNEGESALPEGLLLPCSADGGPLATAIIEQCKVNQARSRQGTPFGATCSDLSGSSLALPLTGRRTQWVLYIESELMTAFAQEEEELLELLVRETAAVLQRSSLFELHVAVLGAINDAVIETHNDGSIRWSNEAARQLLGLDPEPDGKLNIADLLQATPEADELLQLKTFYHREVTLTGRQQRQLPVMLSASVLPDHLGGRVYVASDYSFQREAQQLDQLKSVFRHAALEGRTPLALAAAWLQQLAVSDSVDPHGVQKILRQLARADLPLERLLRLVSSEQQQRSAHSADLGQALCVTLDELPGSMLEGLDQQPASQALPVTAEFNDLQFCVESMIAFALRTRPQSKLLKVRTGRVGDIAQLSVSGDWVPDMGSAYAAQTERWQRKTICDLTLGEQAIADIAKRGGGTFICNFEHGLELVIRFPLRREEAI